MNRRRFLHTLLAAPVAAAAVWRLPTAVEPSVTLKFIQQFDMVQARMVSRFDVLYGWSVVAPDVMVRITNG
jgi:hypothetical protein